MQTYQINGFWVRFTQYISSYSREEAKNAWKLYMESEFYDNWVKIEKERVEKDILIIRERYMNVEQI